MWRWWQLLFLLVARSARLQDQDIEANLLK